MEYEQMEYGRRVVMEAITRQDINGYHDLLSPEVLLVTHFPYPTSSSDSNMQAVQQWMQLSQQQQQQQQQSSSTAAANHNAKSKRRARELLLEQERQRERQQKRYEAFRKRREGQHGGAGDGAGTSVNDSTEVEAAASQGGAGAMKTSASAAPSNNRGRPDATDAGGRRRTPSSKAATKNTPASGRSSNSSSSSAAAARVPLGVRWFRQQQQQQKQQQSQQGAAGVVSGSPPPQRSPTIPGGAASSTTPTQTSFAAAAVAAVAQKGSGDEANTGQSRGGDRLAYEDVVDIAEGRLLTSFRFFELLHFVSTGKGVTSIAPVEMDVQLRKDILQEDEVLPLPPPPTTVQEQYEQLGTQFTERNQPLSCITVVWGRDYLLFKDKIYFDDGLIVTIQRSMLPVPEVIARALPPASWTTQQQQQHQQQHHHVHAPPAQQQQQRLSDRKAGAASTLSPSSPLSGRMQSLATAQIDQAYRAVEAFYGVSASRVNATNTAWALLDYSFLEAPEPSVLLRLAPGSGQPHVNKAPRVAADPRLAQGVFLNQNNDPSSAAAQAGGSRTLIKAKNKRGEEEAYEFNDNRHRFSLLQHNTGGGDGGSGGGAGDGMEEDGWGLGNGSAGDGVNTGGNSSGGAGKRKGEGASGNGGGGGGGGAVRGQRYDASCVRVSGCHLQSKMDQLVPVLRRLVANSLLTLHTLDLSQNRIATLPDLRLLPLQNLKLHDNAIADWRVVEHYIAPLPYLAILTLHGNPIAEEKETPRQVAALSGPASVAPTGNAGKHHRSRDGAVGATGESSYWKKLLALLLGNPARVAPLRQVDFVTLTGQDFNLAGAHALFTTGKSDVLNRARTLNTGVPQKSVSVAKSATRADSA